MGKSATWTSTFIDWLLFQNPALLVIIVSVGFILIPTAVAGIGLLISSLISGTVGTLFVAGTVILAIWKAVRC